MVTSRDDRTVTKQHAWSPNNPCSRSSSRPDLSLSNRQRSRTNHQSAVARDRVPMLMTAALMSVTTVHCRSLAISAERPDRESRIQQAPNNQDQDRAPATTPTSCRFQHRHNWDIAAAR